MSDRRRRTASSHHSAGSARGRAGREPGAARTARPSGSTVVGAAAVPDRSGGSSPGQSTTPTLVDQLRKPFLVSFVVFVITAVGLVLVVRTLSGG